MSTKVQTWLWGRERALSQIGTPVHRSEMHQRELYFAIFLCIHQPSMSVFFPQTPAEITSTPYSRQMQLWPMMRSTLCPCRTSTPRRWRWTRCSATATSRGDSGAASWVSSKRWRSNFGLLFFFFLLFCLSVGLLWKAYVDHKWRPWRQTWSEDGAVDWDLNIYPSDKSHSHTKQSRPW